MRPRTTKKIDRLLLAGAIGALLAAGTMAQADAETATITGTFGVGPKWSTVQNLCPCESVQYSAWPSQGGIAGGVQGLEQKLAQVGISPSGIDRVVGYSLGSVVALGYIRDNPEEAQRVRWTLMGSPDTPEGRPSRGPGHRKQNGLPDGDWSNVEFVVKQYDPVTDIQARPNFLASINARLSVHTKGYDGIDLEAPDATYTDPRTGAVTKYYRTDVLPILKGWDWLLNDAQMAKLDAKYRPRVEKAYDRPVDLEDTDDVETPELSEEPAEVSDSDEETQSSASRRVAGQVGTRSDSDDGETGVSEPDRVDQDSVDRSDDSEAGDE